MQVLVTDPLEGALTSLWNVSAFVESTVADVLRSDRRAINDNSSDVGRNVGDEVDDDENDDSSDDL